MQYTFDLTHQDHIDFNLFYIKDSAHLKKQVRINRIVMTILPVMAGIVYFLANKEDWLDWLPFGLTMAVLAVLIFIFFPKLFFILVKKNTGKLLSEKNNSLLGRRTMIFEETLIRQESEQGDSTLYYSAVIEVKDSGQAVYLFNGPASALILPDRIFSSREEKQALLDFIRAKTFAG